MTNYSGFFGHVPMMQHALAGLVRWDAHLSIGNRAIDAQDQAIFRLVSEIDELWRHGARAAEWRAIADRAGRLLAAHFHYEERMLAEVRYPALAKHAAEHQEMLEDLASIRARLNGDDDRDSGYAGLQLANFMLCVTIGHILNSDSDYTRYIMDETAKLSTGCA
jgi:hemerythrin-like metal-binding protein